MKIIVTGSEGFIGQHVVRKLVTLGHEVVGVDWLDPQVHGKAMLDIRREGYEFHLDNAGSYDYEPSPDVVIHLAAKVGVGQSMYQIGAYVHENTACSAAMLDTLAKVKPKRLIVASSMSVYGEGGTEPVREDRPVDLRSIYALTKYDQEQMCLIWGHAYKVPTVALRFFNVFGPGQSLNNPYTGVMAIFASRLLNGNPPVIYGDGFQSRDFIHVDDVANAVVHAATKDIDSGVYNVGTGNYNDIRHVAYLLSYHLTENRIEALITGKEREGDIRRCYADVNKLHKTGWSADIGFERGIQAYCMWLLKQPKPIDRFDVAHKELVAHGLTD